MTADQMQNLVKEYRDFFQRCGIPAKEAVHWAYPTQEELLPHLHHMCLMVEGMLESYQSEAGSPEDWEKANRWLGFIQGVLWSQTRFTLHELRMHNKKGICVTSAF